MSRFPSDFLPAYESNQSGQQAPVTRLKLGVPKGVNLTGEEVQQVEDEIFKRYRAPALRQLNTFRQMRNASQNEMAAQRKTLDEYASVKYYSHQGLEYYTLSVSEELVAEILEIELNPLCLLIIHNDGIRAIRMSDVYKHDFKTEYESDNGGQSDHSNNSQMQLTKKWTYSTYYGLCTTEKVSVGNSGGGSNVFNGHADDTGATIYFTGQTIRVDVLDDDSSVIGTNDDTDVCAITADGERKKIEREDNRDSAAPNYGTKKETYYFEQSKVGTGERHADAPTVIKKVWDYEKKKDLVWNVKALTGWNRAPAEGCKGNGALTPTYDDYESHTDSVKERFDGETTYYDRYIDDGVEPAEKFWVQHKVDTYGPVSLDLYDFTATAPNTYIFGFLTSSGGVANNYFVVSSQTEPSGSSQYYAVGYNWGVPNIAPNASNVMSSTFDGIYLYGPTDWWVELYSTEFCANHHISTTITYEGPFSSSDTRKTKRVRDPRDFVEPHFFPYAVDNKIYKTVETWAEDFSASTKSVHTPYGPLVENKDWLQFNGWLNLSDGGVLIQGCYILTSTGYTYGLYIDGQKYDSVGGLAVQQIHTMVLNVPLDWIKKQWS